MTSPTPYRDGHLYVCSEMCDTCVFHKGNRMSLAPGRLRDLVQSNLEDDAALTCHSTIWWDDEERHAICRGFYDRLADQSVPLRLAQALDIIVFIQPPSKVGD